MSGVELVTSMVMIARVFILRVEYIQVVECIQA